jgi:ribosomal protein L18
MWSLHRAAIARGLPPTVPAGVLAEAWRGGPQHRLSMLLKGCKVEDLNEAQARRVGGLVAECGLDDTVDVAVAEGAMRRNDVVVTSNRAHISQVVDAVRGSVPIQDV